MIYHDLLLPDLYIDLEVEPVCDVICFNPNLLISEESEELPENLDTKI